MATYRRRRASGDIADDAFGDVFLVVDGWGTVRQEYEDLEQSITQIAARGLGYGVHVVISVSRYMEMRANIRDLLGTRLELRLGDPSESEVDRRTAQNVPNGSPGRGLAPGKLHFISALPRIDGKQTAEDLTDGVTDLVQRMREAWPYPPAPAVRLLPTLLQPSELPPADSPAGLPIGLNESQLKPVALDFKTDPHLLVFGDSESASRLSCGTCSRVWCNAIRPTRRASLSRTIGEACWVRWKPSTSSATPPQAQR